MYSSATTLIMLSWVDRYMPQSGADPIEADLSRVTSDHRLDGQPSIKLSGVGRIGAAPTAWTSQPHWMIQICTDLRPAGAAPVCQPVLD